jgi:hypothetical protein
MSQDDSGSSHSQKGAVRGVAYRFDRFLHRISMVSTVILIYDADSPGMLDTRRRIKIPCHLNGRRYPKSETAPVDTTVAIEISTREMCASIHSHTFIAIPVEG